MRVAILALLATLLPLWQTAAHGDSANPTVVQVGSSTLAAGRSGRVDITVTNIPPAGLSGYNVTISFDRKAVKVESVSSGEAPFDGPPIANIDDDNGVVLLASVVASGPTSGSLAVARLTVTARGRSGDSVALMPTINELIDNDLNDIAPRDVVAGSITITGPPPRSWTWVLWLLAPLLLAAAAWALGRWPANGKAQ